MMTADGGTPDGHVVLAGSERTPYEDPRIGPADPTDVVKLSGHRHPGASLDQVEEQAMLRPADQR